MLSRYLILILIPVCLIGITAIVWASGMWNPHTTDFSALKTYEFTVWADSLDPDSHGAVPMVQLSEIEAVRASMLILQNKDSLIPIREIHDKKFYLLTLGERLPYLEEYMNYYTSVGYAHVPTVNDVPALSWSKYSHVCIAINATDWKEEDIERVVRFIKRNSEVILLNFDRYEKLLKVKNEATIIQAPSSQSVSQMITAQVVFGGVPVYRGTPQKMAEVLRTSGDFFSEKIRLGYAEPERVGISSDSLRKIDKIIREGLRQYAFPGCQVLIAKSGEVVFHKSYGYHTYDRKRPVRKNDLYDLASITKVAATTLAAMKLYDEELLHPDSALGNYFHDASFTPTRVYSIDTLPKSRFEKMIAPILEDTASQWILPDTSHLGDSMVLVFRERRGKGILQNSTPVFDIPLRDLLTHTSGLPSTLPIQYYQKRLSSSMFSKVTQKGYSVPVASDFFLKDSYIDTLWNETKSLPVDSPRYCYSCVNMFLMQQVVDSINQEGIQPYLQDNFYQPLGLQTMTYLPRQRFPRYRLIPTAIDRWREQLIHGSVHDPIAALMGGVSGNAGLFSNANDLAILGQLLLNGGAYGGQKFIEEETIDRFASRQRGHRGFGFDKPPRKVNYIVAPSAPIETFGHTGFTGTCLWVDPVNEIVFVFLSNRIYPSVSNYRINELKIRQRVHQVIYDAMDIPWRYLPPKEEELQFQEIRIEEGFAIHNPVI